MKSDLTIIIPFLNESDEIENTIQSILETTLTNPDIILINDCSNDNYDYEKVVNNYKSTSSIIYISHKKRKGVAASRNEGVVICKTSYFLLLDGHMRFYEKGWDKRLIELLRINNNCIICGQTKILNRDSKYNISTNDNIIHYGAYINLENLDTKWNNYDTNSNLNIIEIPCILGAAYAMEKMYWLYLNGLNGLKSYGMDEQLISMKVWLQGGRCLLVKDWFVGHIYRTNFPYTNPRSDFMYNKIFLAELLIPFSTKQKIFENLRRTNSTVFEESYFELKSTYHILKEEKKHLHRILKKPFLDFKVLNDKFIILNK